MVGADVPLEQAALAQKASTGKRTHIFARLQPICRDGATARVGLDIRYSWHDRGVTVSTSGLPIALHISKKAPWLRHPDPADQVPAEHPAGKTDLRKAHPRPSHLLTTRPRGTRVRRRICGDHRRAYLIEDRVRPVRVGLVAARAARLGRAHTGNRILAPRYELRTLLLVCAALRSRPHRISQFSARRFPDGCRFLRYDHPDHR